MLKYYLGIIYTINTHDKCPVKFPTTIIKMEAMANINTLNNLYRIDWYLKVLKKQFYDGKWNSN